MTLLKQRLLVLCEELEDWTRRKSDCLRNHSMKLQDSEFLWSSSKHYHLEVCRHKFHISVEPGLPLQNACEVVASSSLLLTMNSPVTAVEKVVEDFFMPVEDDDATTCGSIPPRASRATNSSLMNTPSGLRPSLA